MNTNRMLTTIIATPLLLLLAAVFTGPAHALERREPLEWFSPSSFRSSIMLSYRIAGFRITRNDTTANDLVVREVEPELSSSLSSVNHNNRRSLDDKNS